MDDNYIYLRIIVNNNIYAFEVIHIRIFPNFVFYLMNKILKRKINNLNKVFISRYGHGNKLIINLVKLNKIDNYDTRINSDIYKLIYSSILIKILILIFKHRNKVIKNKVNFSNYQIKKHLIRDLRFMEKEKFESILIVGKFSHEEFFNMGDFDWRKILDRKLLNRKNLKIRQELLGLDFVASLPIELYKENLDLEELIDRIEIIHICELNKYIHYKLNDTEKLKNFLPKESC